MEACHRKKIIIFYHRLKSNATHCLLSIRLRKLSAEIKLLSQYGSTCTCPYPKKKMDTLFLGVSHVVPCCVLWFFSREPERTYGRKQERKSIYDIISGGSAKGYFMVNACPQIQ